MGITKSFSDLLRSLSSQFFDQEGQAFLGALLVCVSWLFWVVAPWAIYRSDNKMQGLAPVLFLRSQSPRSLPPLCPFSCFLCLFVVLHPGLFSVFLRGILHPQWNQNLCLQTFISTHLPSYFVPEIWSNASLCDISRCGSLHSYVKGELPTMTRGRMCLKNIRLKKSGH